MKKIIYLILAHQNPNQLERMIKKLKDDHSYFYIHIDKKTDINLFCSLNKIENVELIENRIDNIWGDFSSVIATINLIEIALKKQENGMFILLSGMDYPIKTKENIRSFITLNFDKNFIDICQAEKVWSTFNNRANLYKINLSNSRGNYILLKGLNKISIKHFIERRISLIEFFKIIFIERKLNLDMDFYGGSQWWAMNFKTLKKVNTFIINNKTPLYDYFKYSLLPDEWFFQSIIHHIMKTDLSIKIEDSLTYVNWSRKNCKLPVTFVDTDINELMSQNERKLFARKFDVKIDKHILNTIDKNIS